MICQSRADQLFADAEQPHLIIAYCWFANDVTAAMLVVKNKRVSLRWEMNSILMQILQKNFFCIDHQHGRLVTWLQTKNCTEIRCQIIFIKLRRIRFRKIHELETLGTKKRILRTKFERCSFAREHLVVF